MVTVVTLPQATNPLVDLLADGPSSKPATGAETLVVAVGATADSNRSIDVRAGEAGVDTYALDAISEPAAEIEAVGIISQAS
jgi:hypothetical protein